jgi:hypothetical protein
MRWGWGQEAGGTEVVWLTNKGASQERMEVSSCWGGGLHPWNNSLRVRLYTEEELGR